MNCKALWWSLTLTLGIVFSGFSSADEKFTLGVRGGFSARDVSGEDFKQLEAFVTYELPWNWQSASGWFLGTRLNGAAGALWGGSKTGFVGSLGPGLVLGKDGWPVALDIGVSPTLFGKHEFGDADFGGTLQFTSHVGINFLFGQNFTAGYRFQHTSNASIYSSNPGLEMHMFQLGYRF